MIEAKELRIGNWVTTDSEEQVIDVLCDSINTNKHECISYELINPIPITEEWLVRFGFSTDDRLPHAFSIPAIEGYVKITVIKNNVCIDINGNRCLTNVKYINQLQNLYFALTGEELK